MFQPPSQRTENDSLIEDSAVEEPCHENREDDVSATPQNEEKHDTSEPGPKLGMGTRLRCAQTLTCGVVIEGVHVLLSAVASKEGFVVVILIPVE